MKQTVRGMILGCTLAAALVLTGCMNSNSGANSASQSHSTSGTASGSGASQTEDRSGWRTGMSVLTEMTEQDENGKLNTITAAVVLDGEGRIRDVQLDELELTVTADDTGKVDLPSDHRTKRQKGEDYPLAAVSSLKAGWAEQVDAFGRWLTGKTADQVRGLEVSPRTVRWGGTLSPSGDRAGDGMARFVSEEKAAGTRSLSSYIKGLSRRSTLSSTVPGRLVRQSVTCTSRHWGSVASTSSRRTATWLLCCSSTPHSKCRNRLR